MRKLDRDEQLRREAWAAEDAEVAYYREHFCVGRDQYGGAKLMWRKGKKPPCDLTHWDIAMGVTCAQKAANAEVAR